MRLSKFLISVILVTGFALLYVYQQTEILRLAYVGQKKIAAYEVLLDKNSILRYNTFKDASLVHIGSIFAESSDFQMPEHYRLVRLESPPANSKALPQALKNKSIIARIFGIKRQAEAKTVNP